MGYGKNPDQVKKLIRALPKDYQEPVDKALRSDEEDDLDFVWERCRNLSERTSLANIYLQSRDYYDKIKASEGVWKHIFEDLGYNDQDNPFMTLLNNMKWEYISNIPEASARQVLNAYTSRVIDADDLRDEHGLLRNPNLYTKVFTGDERQSEEYLEEWFDFEPKKYKKKLEASAGRALSDDEIRNFIFFGLFDTRPDTGILVPYPTLQKAKSQWSDAPDEKTRQEKSKKLSDLLKYDTKAEAIAKLLKGMSSTERADVLKAILDAYKGEIKQ